MSSSDDRARVADLGFRIQAELARHGLSRGEMVLRRLRWMIMEEEEVSILSPRDLAFYAQAIEEFRPIFDDLEAGRIARPL